jgi:hypothetical protein
LKNEKVAVVAAPEVDAVEEFLFGDHWDEEGGENADLDDADASDAKAVGADDETDSDMSIHPGSEGSAHVDTDDDDPPPLPPPVDAPAEHVFVAVPAVVRAHRALVVGVITLEVPGLGKLMYYPSANDFYAVCTDDLHVKKPEHADYHDVENLKPKFCRKVAKASFGRKRGQGRPLGFLMSWLQQHHRHGDSTSHIHGTYVTYAMRIEGRNFLKTLAGCEQLFDREALKADVDGESEPEQFD